jgi:putative SOS response-associated peptidase YedK
MCFTIAIHQTRTEIEIRYNKKFEAGSENFEPRYYFSAFDFPEVPVISQEKSETISVMHWGLIPSWLRDIDKVNEFKLNTLNAKAETLLEKPSFRQSVSGKRCLIIVNGFFEWQHVGKEKIPYFIHLKDEELFSLGGLYDKWVNNKTGGIYKGFSILTCEANPLMERIHNTKKRMPVIIPKNDEELWIDNNYNFNSVSNLLRPLSEKLCEAWPINDLINDRKADKNKLELLNKRTANQSGDQIKLF